MNDLSCMISLILLFFELKHNIREANQTGIFKNEVANLDFFPLLICFSKRMFKVRFYCNKNLQS